MGGTSRTSTSVAPRSPPAAVIFDIGGTILEERWYDLQAALRAVVPDTRLADDLSVEFQRLVSEQHRANREVALAGWLLARLPEIIFTLEELEDELWRHVVELMPFAGVSDILAQIAADRIPVAAISNAPFSARVLAGELGRYGLLNHFRFVISSADLGLRKPAPTIFETALHQLGARRTRPGSSAIRSHRTSSALMLQVCSRSGCRGMILRRYRPRLCGSGIGKPLGACTKLRGRQANAGRSRRRVRYRGCRYSHPY